MSPVIIGDTADDTILTDPAGHRIRAGWFDWAHEPHKDIHTSWFWRLKCWWPVRWRDVWQVQRASVIQSQIYRWPTDALTGRFAYLPLERCHTCYRIHEEDGGCPRSSVILLGYTRSPPEPEAVPA